MPAGAGRSERVDGPGAPAEATRGLYELYRAPVYRFCLSRLGSREEAEDAVQSTFLRAHAALRGGVRPALASAWLFTIARNVCRSRRLAALRRGRVETPRDLAAMPEALLARRPQEADELVGLEEALAAMPPRLRRVLLLREWQGLSYRELAAELGATQPAVETLLFRARRELAHLLRQPVRRVRDLIGLGPLAGIRALFRDTAAVKLSAVATSAVVMSAAAPGFIDRPVVRAAAAPPPRVVVEAATPARTAEGHVSVPTPPTPRPGGPGRARRGRGTPTRIADDRGSARSRAPRAASAHADSPMVPSDGHRTVASGSGCAAAHAERPTRPHLAGDRREPAARVSRPAAGRRARAAPAADRCPAPRSHSAARPLPAASRLRADRPRCGHRAIRRRECSRRDPGTARPVRGADHRRRAPAPRSTDSRRHSRAPHDPGPDHSHLRHAISNKPGREPSRARGRPGRAPAAASLTAHTNARDAGVLTN